MLPTKSMSDGIKMTPKYVKSVTRLELVRYKCDKKKEQLVKPISDIHFMYFPKFYMSISIGFFRPNDRPFLAFFLSDSRQFANPFPNLHPSIIQNLPFNPNRIYFHDTPHAPFI